MEEEIFFAEPEPQAPPTPIEIDEALRQYDNDHLGNYTMEALDKLRPYELQVEQIKELATNLVVNSDAGQEQAEKVKAVALKIVKEVGEREKELTKDAKAYIESVRNMAKRITVPLQESANSLKVKSQSWTQVKRLEAERKAKEEREAMAKLQEKINQEAAELQVEAPVLPTPIAPPVTGTIRTEYGTTYEQKGWDIEIVDLRQVPWQYLRVELNKTAINQEIKAGVREIPGLKIIPKSDQRTRTR